MLGVQGFEGHVAKVATAFGHDGVAQDIIGIGCDYVDFLFGNVGVDIADIEQVDRIMLLLRHAEYAADGLDCELVARQFAENKQHRRARAVPAQGYGFFEKQHLRKVVGAFEPGEIFFFV